MMRLVLWAAAATAILGNQGAMAADLGPDYTPPRHCIIMQHSPISDLPSRAQIQDELDKRYFHAVDVASSPGTIYSTQPTFTWANHAKASCGKAIGFLKSGEVNVEMIDRCDCFHGRMVYFRGNVN